LRSDSAQARLIRTVSELEQVLDDPPLIAKVALPALAKPRSALELLLHPERIDLIPRFIYVKQRMQGVSQATARRVYLRNVFSLAAHDEVHDPIALDQTGVETITPSRGRVEDYLDSFDALIKSMQRDGFDPQRSVIPVGHNGVALDGGHRIAAAAYLGIPVWTVDVDWHFSRDLEYFTRYGRAEAVADEIALNYVRIDPLAAIVTVFPVAHGEDAYVERELRTLGSIVHKKEIRLQRRAATMLLAQMYAGSEWIGTGSEGFPGARLRAERSFPSAIGQITSPLRAYVLASSASSGLMRACKERIRGHYRKGNESIHITDSYWEAQVLAGVYFNHNSLAMLYAVRPRGRTPNFDDRLRTLVGLAERRSLDPEAVCIDSGAVLAVHRLRDCNDVDLIYPNGTGAPEILESDGRFDPHNPELARLGVHPDDLIFDPKRHFYYMGLKFTSPADVMRMKRIRNEAKDQRDIAMLRSAYSRQGVLDRILLTYETRKYFLKRQALGVRFLIRERPDLIPALLRRKIASVAGRIRGRT
jgi:hypothetical protein